LIFGVLRPSDLVDRLFEVPSVGAVAKFDQGVAGSSHAARESSYPQGSDGLDKAFIGSCAEITPALGVPNLNSVNRSDDDDFSVKASEFPQPLGQQYATLRIWFDLSGVRRKCSHCRLWCEAFTNFVREALGHISKAFFSPNP